MPHLGAHETLSFDVSLDWTNVLHVADRAETQHAKLDLIANTDVATLADGSMDMTEHFEQPSVDGVDEIGRAFQAVASAITSASVTTRIGHDGAVISSRIDGATDSDVRAIVADLGQLVSFRFVEPDAVAIGDEWDRSWIDTATGTVETGAHYRLASVMPCGDSICGVIDVRGRDADGRSQFHGQLVLELDSLRPVSKHVESTTTSSGEQDGSHYTLEMKTIMTANRR